MKIKSKIVSFCFKASLRDHFNSLPKENKDDPFVLPDLSGFVSWDQLENALKGIRESIEKSSNDAAAALASARQPVQLVERQSQTVSSLDNIIFLSQFRFCFF